MKPLIVQQIEEKAPINNPALTGAATAPTPPKGDNSTNIATTAFVATSTPAAMTGATASAPGTAGTVPAPSAGAQNLFLSGDGTWKKPYVNTDTTDKLFVLGATSSGNTDLYLESNVYMQGDVLYGAAWNDYAEYREATFSQPGFVVCENGNDTLSLSTERLQPAANIVSDTFGFAIGQTEKCQTPIAVSGRVLAYPYENRDEYKPGDAVCSAPDGMISKMTREEIREYPDRILGTVSSIPDYEIWGEKNISVNGRIWIKVK